MRYGEQGIDADFSPEHDRMMYWFYRNVAPVLAQYFRQDVLEVSIDLEDQLGDRYLFPDALCHGKTFDDKNLSAVVELKPKIDWGQYTSRRIRVRFGRCSGSSFAIPHSNGLWVAS